MILKNKILILGGISCIFYAFLAYIPFGFGTLSTPPIDPKILSFLFFINLGLFLIYLLTFRLLKKEPASPKLVRVIVLFSLLFSIILLLLPSIGSADIFNYIFRARVFTVYGENPYLVTTENFPQDIFNHFSPKEWNYLPMQYGPLWAGISIGFSTLAKDSFFWNQFLYKLLALVINLGMIYFIGKILSLTSPDYKITGLFLYAWNPFILFEVINNAHNDIFLIFLAIVALYLLLKKRHLWSLIFLLLSVLIKYISLLLFPFFIIFIFKEMINKRERIKFFVKAAFALALIVFLFYLPFWEGWQTLQGLFLQSDIASFINLSLFPSFIFGGAYLLSNFFSWSYQDIIQIVRFGGISIFAIIYFWQLKKSFPDKDSSGFIYRNFLILFLYTIFAVVFLRSWYFLWTLPLAILIDKKYFLHFIFLITFLGLFSYSIVVISILFLLLFVVLLLIQPFVKERFFSTFLGLK